MSICSKSDRFHGSFWFVTIAILTQKVIFGDHYGKV
jgi:hypothetical protein